MLQLIDKTAGGGVWVEGWFELANGNCVVERFTVIGESTYAQINAALEFFGKEVLDARLNSLQTSGEFAERYLYPVVRKQQQQAAGINCVTSYDRFHPVNHPIPRHSH